MLGIEHTFLDFLHDHTSERIEENRYIAGSLSSCWMSKLNWRRFSVWRFGASIVIQLARKVAAWLLKGQRSRVCFRESMVSMLHKSQAGLVMLGMLILCSLSLVGKMLWNRSQRKVESSEGKPGVEDSYQICSQLLSGLLSSVLVGFNTRSPLTSM